MGNFTGTGNKCKIQNGGAASSVETRQTRVDSRSQNGCKKKHLTSFRGQLAVSENNSGLPTRRLSSSESKFSGDGGETREGGASQKFCCRLFLASMASRMGCL